MSENWIENRDIEDIEGALCSSTYIARAYRHVKENNGVYPEWAKKSDKGRWLFDSSYILLDARQNLKTMSVSEAAELLGASRRAVQNWVDRDLILTIDVHGNERRINRDQFMRDLSALKSRLETPAVIGFKLRHGGEVSDDQIIKAEEEKDLKKKKALERNRLRRKAKRKVLRDEERATGYYAEIKKASDAKKRAEKERRLASKRIKDKTAEEKEAIKKEAQIRAAAKIKLKATERAKKNALKAIEREEQRGAKLKEMINKELQEAKDTRIQASKEKKAAIVETRLKSVREQELTTQEAKLKARRREERRKKQDIKDGVSKEQKLKKVKQKTAADIEELLKSASQRKQAEVIWRKQAVAIAEKIMDDMLDNDMSQIDAMLLFNDIAESGGIPQAIHIAVRKDIIGR